MLIIICKLFRVEQLQKNSDSSFILINFNDETGYVNKIDLVTFSVHREGSLKSLEEKNKFLKFEKNETFADELYKSKLKTENNVNKNFLKATNRFSSIMRDNNYFWRFITYSNTILFNAI